jgi:hypothetical protein
LKRSLFILAAIVLVAAGIWIVHQRQSIATFENESVILQKHIATASSGGGVDFAHPKAAGSAEMVKDKEPLDLKKIAAQFGEMEQNGEVSGVRTMMKLQQQLQMMTPQELAAALDEIASLELAEDSRNELEPMLIEALVEKDPEFALTRFIDRLQGDRGAMLWHLAKAMQKWARKDLAKATAWFDQQNAAGKFDSKALDGKGEVRNQFEGSLISVLLASDPEAASHRLGAMAADQRSGVLMQHSLRELELENPMALATLVREQVPLEDQGKTLARLASSLVGVDGYAKVTEFMNRIVATPAERKECVEEAADSVIQSLSYRKKITLEDLDTMRVWTNIQAPGSTDMITGKALANSVRGRNEMDFVAASELALHYHKASSNDDVLVTFLNDALNRQNNNKVRALAEKITDVKRREEILERLK